MRREQASTRCANVPLRFGPSDTFQSRNKKRMGVVVRRGCEEEVASEELFIDHCNLNEIASRLMLRFRELGELSMPES